jgi:tryptophan synthase beta subunit
MRMAKEADREVTLLVNLSGRGDKDVQGAQEWLGRGAAGARRGAGS